MKIAGPGLVAIVWLILAAGPAWAISDDEAAVRQVVLQTVKAVADFPASKDPQSVLGLYTADYSGIQDGESEGIEAVRRWLEEYGDLLAKGSPIRYAGEITDLTVHVSETWAWATYRYVFQMVRAGQVEGEDRGLCTNIIRKERAGWMIQHEHCSQKRRS
jgi:hypothetical protein